MPGAFPIAHGALGPFDEILIVLALGIFVVMLAIPPLLTWFKNRQNPTPTTDQISPTEAATPEKTDHYRLE